MKGLGSCQIKEAREGRDSKRPSLDFTSAEKSSVAAEVWARLGNVANYCEPFFGSGAVLLLRPHAPKIETVSDLDSYLCNFWRATKHDPEAVVEYADGPVMEADLHARHRWLVLSDDAAAFRERMRHDPDYYDPKIAGWWVWGICCWIGSGWCNVTDTGTWMEGRTADGDCEQRTPQISNSMSIHAKGQDNRKPLIGGGEGQLGHGIHAAGPQDKRPLLGGRSERDDGHGVHRKLKQKKPQACGNGYSSGIHVKGQMPELSGDDGASGRGVHASGMTPVGPANSEGYKRPKIPDGGEGSGINGQARPQLADAYSRGRGVNGNDDAGTCAQRRAWLLNWFNNLRDRFRTVRVCCGDWRRVCDSESVTTRLGMTGIFFDPPYGAKAKRDMKLYAKDSGTVAADVRAYCLERGQDPAMRIALCGYVGEGHEVLEANGWSVFAWESQGGYGNRTNNANKKKERIWFSPFCQHEEMLF
jgi:hypothetical protein